ncbi:MAG TPA: NUDIX hydrolase [Microlunatus sp.]|nr:NUDIX hydrolase [Microlunatus sp.]
MTARVRYQANVCVLLHRAGRWLLSVRAPGVDYAPGQLGLIGGHVEPLVGAGVFETTARREVAEETGLDLAEVALDYLTSELYLDDEGGPVLAVTFVGELPDGQEPTVAAPDELSSVGWWAADELAAVPNCAPWVPPLVAAAEELLSRR